MQVEFKRRLEDYNLLELGDILSDLKRIERQVTERENEIRRECGDIVSLLDDLITEHETNLNDDGTPRLTVEEVRAQAAPLIEKLGGFKHNWKRRFSSFELFYLTGEE